MNKNPTSPANPRRPQLDFRATHYEVRILTERGCFADRSDYCGTLNVVTQGTYAFVSMLQGYWSIHCDRALKRFLLEQGVRHLFYEHNRVERYAAISAKPYETLKTSLHRLQGPDAA